MKSNKKNNYYFPDKNKVPRVLTAYALKQMLHVELLNDSNAKKYYKTESNKLENFKRVIDIEILEK